MMAKNPETEETRAKAVRRRRLTASVAPNVEQLEASPTSIGLSYGPGPIVPGNGRTCSRT